METIGEMIVTKKSIDLVCPECRSWMVLYPGRHIKEDFECPECRGDHVDFMPDPCDRKKALKRVLSLERVPVMRKFYRKNIETTPCIEVFNLVTNSR